MSVHVLAEQEQRVQQTLAAIPAGQIPERVRQAGIVGAGGAGFPTYVKLQAQAEIYLVNAAECEPMLKVDQQLRRSRHHNWFEACVTAWQLPARKKASSR